MTGSVTKPKWTVEVLREDRSTIAKRSFNHRWAARLAIMFALVLRRGHTLSVQFNKGESQ